MLAYNLKRSVANMNYYLIQLKWLINALALEPKLLHTLLPPNSYIPNEMTDQYEMIVDENLSDIVPVLTAEQLEHFKPLHNYINSLFVREDLIDCWYDNDFIYSLEWNVIHTMAKGFEQYMGWQISEPLQPLYSEIIYVDTDDH